MRKISFIFFSTLILCAACGIGSSFAVDNAASAAMTNLQFAQMLAQRLNVVLAPGTENLPEDQYFSALASALAAKNITIFVNANKTDTVTNAKVVEALYAVAGGSQNNADVSQKAAFLVEKGVLSAVPADLNAAASVQDTQNILSSPALSTLIAETYTPPAAGDEPPASRI